MSRRAGSTGSSRRLRGCATTGTAPGGRAASAAALACLVLVSGCAPGAPTPPTGAASAVAAEAGVPPTSRRPPVGVEIPRISARSPLTEVGRNPDRSVEMPPIGTPMRAAWFRHSPVPGDTGPAVVLGHVDGAGQPGIFHRLREVVIGDHVLVEDGDGKSLEFTVYRTQQVAEASFPTDDVYAATPGPELRLITCGGVFDHGAGGHLDNTIVYARLDS
ncbi:class F sortase [Actinosynnema sp. NPDC023587]|uniref:class F sortase n=1 Tax=Actinosynnema sp. NPDC023587 TaxID=3154695 RepID=UPI0033E4FD23